MNRRFVSSCLTVLLLTGLLPVPAFSQLNLVLLQQPKTENPSIQQPAAAKPSLRVRVLEVFGPKEDVVNRGHLSAGSRRTPPENFNWKMVTVEVEPITPTFVPLVALTALDESSNSYPAAAVCLKGSAYHSCYFFDEINIMRMGGGIGVGFENAEVFLMKRRDAGPEGLLFREKLEFGFLFAVPDGKVLSKLNLGPAAQAELSKKP